MFFLFLQDTYISEHFVSKWNMLVAISNGLQAVQHCCNKILQFFYIGCLLIHVDQYDGHKMFVVLLFLYESV